MSVRGLKTLRFDEARERGADHPQHGNENPIGGTVVVLGAAGAIGRAVVRASIETGRPVVAVAGDVGRLAKLRAEQPGDDITTLAVTIADDAEGARPP